MKKNGAESGVGAAPPKQRLGESAEADQGVKSAEPLSYPDQKRLAKLLRELAPLGLGWARKYEPHQAPDWVNVKRGRKTIHKLSTGKNNV